MGIGSQIQVGQGITWVMGVGTAHYVWLVKTVYSRAPVPQYDPICKLRGKGHNKHLNKSLFAPI